MTPEPKKVLAVASGGGHWKQLLRLRPVFESYQSYYITTIDGLPQKSGVEHYYIVSDCSRDSLMSVVRTHFQILRIFITVRPDVVITTGAAPGLIALLFGRLIFSRTLWIDSIANGDQMSMSGRLARKLAHKVLSQWPAVAQKEGVEYWGQLL